MQIISNIALISINETLIFQLISFLIFMFIINRVMFRPLRQTMDERDSYLQQVKLDIEDAESELRSLAYQMEEREHEVRRQAFAMREKLKDDGQEKAAELSGAVQKEIDALQLAAQKQVEAQLRDARRSIDQEAEALALAIMEKVLDRRMVR